MIGCSHLDIEKSKYVLAMKKKEARRLKERKKERRKGENKKTIPGMKYNEVRGGEWAATTEVDQRVTLFCKNKNCILNNRLMTST